MADNLMCFRVPPEHRAQIEAICMGSGINMSEWLRATVEAALTGASQGLVGVDAGYKTARGYAIHLAKQMLGDAAHIAYESLPPTYEEAQARYGAIGTIGRQGAAEAEDDE